MAEHAHITTTTRLARRRRSAAPSALDARLPQPTLLAQTTTRRGAMALATGLAASAATGAQAAPVTDLQAATPDEEALLTWYRRSTYAGQRCGFRLLNRLQAGIETVIAVADYHRELAAQMSPDEWWHAPEVTHNV